jgi:hypothetical protein
MIAVADHFEPAVLPGSNGRRASLTEQDERLERWCSDYPLAMEPWRDSDGRPFVHTYFYPAEQYHPELIERLATHCHEGWGEVEVHLHHGMERPDTAGNTRHTLECFRDALVEHGCLSRWNGEGMPRYAFVHGNWTLANCRNGLYCGVDNEMEILAETGCYADMTYPAAPSPAQIGKINSLYECTLPFDRQAPQRRGRDMAAGRPPERFPLIIQGPLGIDLMPGAGRLPSLKLENSEITGPHPATLRRFLRWRDMGITVHGRPNWVFVKLHCHGMDPRDRDAMVGDLRTSFLADLTGYAQQNEACRLHFVTAREMTNIVLAACDGHDGDPNEYRNYRLLRITPGKD